MKQNLLFILFAFLISCQPSSIEKNGGLLIEVGYNLNTDGDLPVEKTVDILRSRIGFFCSKNPAVELDSLHNIIRIELHYERDTSLYKDLILTKGRFETLETYENTEIFDYLLQINEILKNNSCGINLPDTLSDSENYPLFTFLAPAITNDGQVMPGATIGYATLRNKSKIDAIFSISEIQDCLPKNATFLWSKFKEGKYYSLVAIKKPVEYTPITGEMIEKTRVEKSNYNDSYIITINLKKQFHNDWAKLTKYNIGRSLALVIDNKVYSHPRVNTEIQGGRSSISGNLDLKQSKTLSAILESGRIEHELYIKKIKIFNTP